MGTTQMTVWQVIDRLIQQVPLSKIKVEAVLTTRLTEIHRSVNTVFLEGGEVELANAIRISKIDLRLSTEPKDPGFLVLEVDGDCISLSNVRTHFSQLSITGAPRGRSMDEATTHSTQLPWGKLSFGFKERKPECLAYVALDPKKS
jgi:hypothetical protein